MIPRYGNLHLLEHRYAASGVDQREVLRRRDDNGAGQRRALRHGQLNVAGARRHVHHQAIEFAPRHFAQQLRHRRHDHRAAPDDGRLLVDHQADRDHLDAIGDGAEREETVRLSASRRGRTGAAPRGRRHRRRAGRRASPPAPWRSARLAATVDLPTPPLPEATAMMLRTPATLSGTRGRPAAPAAG